MRTPTGPTPMPASTDEPAVKWEQYLRDSAVPRSVIDDFLQRPGWVQFDHELGYTLHNSLVQWGVDGSRTIENVGPDGARSRFVYAGQKPRINSYGDSFTECNQVSDGETWQEYLAAHFGEPIRNYGVGGYGVYQAYRRMLRAELSGHGAKYSILYVWGDDPTRSLMGARWAALHRRWSEPHWHNYGHVHGNPWAHLQMELSTGSFVEKENPLATPESLYKMCDADWMVEYLRDDLAVQLGAYARQDILDLNRTKVDLLAEALDSRFNWSSDESCRKEAARLLNLYSQRATNFILDKARAFTDTHDKRLLVALNFTARPLEDYFRDAVCPTEAERHDQEIVDHLAAEGFSYFDMNVIHESEYEQVGGSFSEYMSRYLLEGAGHYKPQGNHLFAYSIKNKLIEILDPRPVAYKSRDVDLLDFSPYLPVV